MFIFYKQKTLQSRFFRSYLLLTMAIVIVFSLFFYHYTSSILIDRETENIVGLTSYMQVQTDQAVRTLDNLSINIGYSNLIMSNLEEYFTQDEYDLSQMNRLANLFVAINGVDTQADQINIFNFSGKVVGFGYININSNIDLNEQEWYQPTLALQGHKYVSAPYSTDSLTGMAKANVYYLSLYRTYFNRYGRQVGMIETMQRCNTVFKPLISLKNSDPDSPDIYVFNQDGVLIYPYRADDQEKLDNPENYLKLIDLSADHTTVNSPVSGQKEVLAYQRSTYSGWTYITVLPENIILTPARQLILLLAGVILILLLVTVILSYSMSIRLARPIKHLRSIIRKTELNTLGSQEQLPLDDSFVEVEELNQAFHSMSGKLKISMDQALYAKHQELKARTVALQSQINPHFYYNSLSSIIILAENNQCDDVVKLSRSLNGIMRYISKGHTPVVTLREELDYLKKYMYCMKIRYQSSLNYDITVSQELEQESIPRLLIQPLVENSLKYGSECYPPWRVSVIGQPITNQFSDLVNQENLRSGLTVSGWIIEVTDNGPGFPAESLELLERRKNDIDQTDGLPEIDIEGMGLANVYARWKLHAGDECIFICDNSQQGGARVRIGRIKYQ